MATRAMIDGYRHYCDRDGNYYPSVTTILSRTATEKSKRSLQSWAEKNPGAREEAATRGTAVHACVEDWIRGKQPDPGLYGNFWEGIERYLEPYEEFLWSERPLRPEWKHCVADDGVARVWHPSGYAGCPDVIARRNDLTVLLDLKTSNQPYCRWFPKDTQNRSQFTGHMKFKKCAMQLAAYAAAIEHTCGQPVDILGILVATPDTTQIFYLTAMERRKAELAWGRKIKEYYKLIQEEAIAS